MTSSAKRKPVTYIVSFVAGVLFAIGLIVAQMVDPQKVIGFLRVFNQWDPSLGLVMVGGIATAMPAFYYVKAKIKRGERATNGDTIELPAATRITPQLAVGSALFGIGWGMLGFCPAPAIVNVFAGYMKAVIFVIAMLAGVWLHAKVVKTA